MGKRIIQQARGKGSSTYRTRKKAFKHRIGYPRSLSGEGEIVGLLNSSGHTAPLAKVRHGSGFFYMPASREMFEGQRIKFEKGEDNDDGDVLMLRDIPLKNRICNVESRPGDGGTFIKSGGSNAVLNRIIGDKFFVLMPSKKEKVLNPKCRATLGVIAGNGRTDKPVLKAGKKHHIKKAKSKLWPRTSAVKVNAIDHPFGSGRGKNPKSKIAKRNAPPGRKVGLLRPKRTGKRK